MRYLAGSPVASVRAVTARHEAASPATESDYTALLTFEDGAAATLVFNAQGYFDIADLTWGIGESGYRTINADSVRPAVRHPVMSAEEKQRFAVEGDPYGRGANGGEDRRSLRKQPFFGITVVHCERGAVRQSPDGVYVYDETGRRELACGAGLRSRQCGIDGVGRCVVRGARTVPRCRVGQGDARSMRRDPRIGAAAA